MKVSNEDPRPLAILGSGRTSQSARLDAAAVRSWQKKVGYLSLFAGVATVVGAQAQDVLAGETSRPVPARVKRAAEMVKKLNAACSKPELLRRQSEYRLPNQKKNFSMLEVLAGGDNCPGNPIPPGTYTSGAPFMDTGDTTGANFTVDFLPQACNGNYAQVAGPDHIYSFTLTARGANPQIRATSTSANYDLSIYVLNGATGDMCPASPGTPADPVNNCLIGADNEFIPNGVETLTSGPMNTLPLNTPLYLFIDSFYDLPGQGGGVGNGPYTVRIQDVTIGGGPTPPENDAPLDFNADGKTDFVMLRNVGGGTSGQVRWLTAFQDGDPTLHTDWGIATDQFFSADYDGDGQDDFAIYREGNPGTFYIVRSLTDTMYLESFGEPGDYAYVAGDYTGDGRADLALYRGGATSADQSFWFYRPLGGGGFTTIPWGQGGDFPAPGDYDGDGKYDFVVQRADLNGVNGRFWKRMNTGAQSTELFGLRFDSIVPGDYDGDGKTDLAVVRDVNGFFQWDFEPSGTVGSTIVSDTWGVSATDYTTQGDYDGDGKTDYAVWRPGNPGRFFMMTVGDRRITHRNWGALNDSPAAYFNTH